MSYPNHVPHQAPSGQGLFVLEDLIVGTLQLMWAYRLELATIALINFAWQVASVLYGPEATAMVAFVFIMTLIAVPPIRRTVAGAYHTSHIRRRWRRACLRRQPTGHRRQFSLASNRQDIVDRSGTSPPSSILHYSNEKLKSSCPEPVCDAVCARLEEGRSPLADEPVVRVHARVGRTVLMNLNVVNPRPRCRR